MRLHGSQSPTVCSTVATCNAHECRVHSGGVVGRRGVEGEPRSSIRQMNLHVVAVQWEEASRTPTRHVVLPVVANTGRRRVLNQIRHPITLCVWTCNICVPAWRCHM